MKEINGNLVFNGEALSVNFVKIFTIAGHRYFVTLIRNNKNHFFEMRQTTQGHWCIVDPPLEWLKEIEAALSELINNSEDQISN